jgi:transposase
VPQRRRHSVEEKRRVVEETLEPSASVVRVARAHGVNANQVFAWRRQCRQGLLERSNGETLLPVRVVETSAGKGARMESQRWSQRWFPAATL